MKSLAARIGRILGIPLVALAIGGVIYQQVGLRRDASLAPPSSEMTLVDGRHVHLACVGEGPQTFVLDAGLGAWSVDWWRVQPLLAASGRVCAFDRAGLGWSEPSPRGHDGRSAAVELAAIVRAAQIRTPFIYVGHSLGAIYAQIYYAINPGDVAGLVLLDPGNPQAVLAGFHGTREAALTAADCPLSCRAAGISTVLGLSRLVVRTGGTVSFPDPLLRARYRAGFARPHTAMTLAAELAATPKTAYENLDVTSFNDLPILILRSAERDRPDPDETEAEFTAAREDYRAYLAALATRSTRSAGPFQIPQSTHATMLIGERSAAVIVDHIRDFAAQAVQMGRSIAHSNPAPASTPRA